MSVNEWRTARIDGELHAAIAKAGKFGESVNDVLRRVFGLPARDDRRNDNSGRPRKKVTKK